jgi:hypothetical protein
MTERGVAELEAFLLDRLPAIEDLVPRTRQLVAEGLDPVEAAKRIAIQADPRVAWGAVIVALAAGARPQPPLGNRRN